jgi:hypothetical protein
LERFADASRTWRQFRDVPNSDIERGRTANIGP